MKKFISVLATFVLCTMLSVPVMASESPNASQGEATAPSSTEAVNNPELSPRTSDTVVIPGLATVGVAGIALITCSVKKTTV